MRFSQVLCFWSKKAVLFKVTIVLTCVYSLLLLTRTRNSMEMPDESENQQILNLISDRELDGRKASLQLNWVQNEEETRKKQEFKRPEKIENADKEIKAKLKASIFTKQVKITNSSLIKTDKSSAYQTAVRNYHEQYKTGNLHSRNKDVISNRRRYIFAFRYYEQLAMASSNLIALASLAKHYNREIIMPFVNNSRMNGVPYQISKRRKIRKFVNMSRYFDVNYVNRTLVERGYAAMAHLDDFIQDCKSEIDVLVHFMFNDSSAEKDAINWFGISKENWKATQRRSSDNNGWTNCEFIKDSGMEILLGGAKVNRYICVDPEVINTAGKLEKLVFRNAACVSIFQWKGIGPNRTHFSLPNSVFDSIKPSNLRHNQRLIDIAKRFVEEYLKRPFLAVHIRAERHLAWKSINQLLKCIKKLMKKILQRQKKFNINRIFIATDLPSYGSDTFHSKKSRERKLARRYLTDALKNPVVFDPMKHGVFDRGEIAIIEMHILSLGESLYTLGGGTFQNWIVDLFLLRNVEDRSLVHKVCLL